MTTPRPEDEYPIINSSEVSFILRLRDIILMLLFWFLYIYFMWDFIIYTKYLIQWWLHRNSGDDTPPDLKVFHIILIYAKTIAYMALALIIWAYYNLFRFRGKTRRKPRPIIGISELSDMYNFKSEEIEIWQKSKVITMHHDKAGQLIKVDISD